MYEQIKFQVSVERDRDRERENQRIAWEMTLKSSLFNNDTKSVDQDDIFDSDASKHKRYYRSSLLCTHTRSHAIYSKETVSILTSKRARIEWRVNTACSTETLK